MKELGEKEQMVHTSTHVRYPVSRSAKKNANSEGPGRATVQRMWNLLGGGWEVELDSGGRDTPNGAPKNDKFCMCFPIIATVKYAIYKKRKQS